MWSSKNALMKADETAKDLKEIQDTILE